MCRLVDAAFARTCARETDERHVLLLYPDDVAQDDSFSNLLYDHWIDLACTTLPETNAPGKVPKVDSYFSIS